MNAKAIRPFIPSIDFETSKSFYKELGFKITYEEDKLIILTSGDVSFFLQDAYLKPWAENTMVQLFVDDLEELHKVASKLCIKFNGFELEPIFEAHYGKTFRLHGPAGELWHVMGSK
jgi:hypothetical protein